MLLKRTSMLGKYIPVAASRFRNTIQSSFVSPEQFGHNLPEKTKLIRILNDEDACEHISRVICDSARQAKQSTPGHDRRRVNTSEERWQKLVSMKDPRIIWHAIGWGGELYIPIFDKDITLNEVKKEIQRLKPGKPLAQADSDQAFCDSSQTHGLYW